LEGGTPHPHRLRRLALDVFGISTCPPVYEILNTPLPPSPLYVTDSVASISSVRIAISDTRVRFVEKAVGGPSLPLPSLFPFPSLSFPLLPFLIPSLPSLFPSSSLSFPLLSPPPSSLPFPSLPLEVGPLKSS